MHELCGAKNRDGSQCKNPPVTGSKRCRMHGGKSLRGIASPTFKTGKYSKDMPTRLAARYEQNLADPMLVELRSELALTDARIGELLASTSISGAAQSWLDAGKELKSLESAIYDPNRSVDQVVAGLEALKSILNRPDDRETWQELYQAIELRRKLADSQMAQAKANGSMIHVDQMMLLAGALLGLIKENITDKQILRKIGEGFSRLMEGIQ